MRKNTEQAWCDMCEKEIDLSKYFAIGKISFHRRYHSRAIEVCEECYDNIVNYISEKCSIDWDFMRYKLNLDLHRTHNNPM